MRVVFLRKEVVSSTADNLHPEDGFIVYHGTNLANLYLIARSRELGSSAGFHTEELRRIGKFYFKTDKTGAEVVANDYAKLMWPPTQARKEDYDPDWLFRLRREPELTYEKIKEITGIDDVFDLYLTMWEMAGGPEGYVRDAASVVLEIIIDNPALRNSTYVDEDILIEKATQGPIDPDEVVRLAIKDSVFQQWVKRITGKKDDQLGSTTYKELENALFTRSDGPLPRLAIRMIFRNAYEALLRILKEGKKEDREEVEDFLRRVASDANSFFFDRIVSFDEVKEIKAEVTTEWGEKKTIDLKSGGALAEIEDIMKKAIVEYAKKWLKRTYIPRGVTIISEQEEDS
jgi:histone H3/H4